MLSVLEVCSMYYQLYGASVAVSTIIMFSALVFQVSHLGGGGNDVNSGTVYSKGAGWRELSGNETFGPEVWS